MGYLLKIVSEFELTETLFIFIPPASSLKIAVSRTDP